MSEVMIRCQNLTKYYGKSRGIENLNLEVFEGEVFGFLGPNEFCGTYSVSMEQLSIGHESKSWQQFWD